MKMEFYRLKLIGAAMRRGIFGSCNGETEEEEKQYYGRASVKRRHEASEGSVRR